MFALSLALMYTRTATTRMCHELCHFQIVHSSQTISLKTTTMHTNGTKNRDYSSILCLSTLSPVFVKICTINYSAGCVRFVPRHFRCVGLRICCMYVYLSFVPPGQSAMQSKTLNTAGSPLNHQFFAR